MELNEQERNRYSRHLILPGIGVAGQLKLKQARVLVVGAGGLGCPVLQYLAAAGVGTIGIIDFDRVEESNLQRQVLYTVQDIGKYKVDAATERLGQQNPHISILPIRTHISAANALEKMSTFDLVIDGSDNFATRYLVSDACVALAKPLVFGSIYQFTGQVSVFNYYNGPSYRSLYPEPGELENCSEAGVIGILPGIIGCLMANEAIKIITGTGDVLSGKLLQFDALAMSFDTFLLQGISSESPAEAIERVQKNKYGFCSNESTSLSGEITLPEFQRLIASGHPFQLLDVREIKEHEQRNLGGTCLPLTGLAELSSSISKELPAVLYCESGIRSRKAADLLRKQGFYQVRSLQGGIRKAAEVEPCLLRTPKTTPCTARICANAAQANLTPLPPSPK